MSSSKSNECKQRTEEKEMPKLRLYEKPERSDTVQGALEQSVLLGGRIRLNSQITKALIGTFTAVSLYFGFEINRNDVHKHGSANFATAKERYDNHLTKNEDIKEKNKEKNCEPLTDKELYMLKGIEQYFASEDATNQDLGWQLLRGTDFKDRINKIDITDQYADSIISQQFCKCLLQINIIDVKSNNPDHIREWNQIMSKINNHYYDIGFPALKQLTLNKMARFQLPPEVIALNNLQILTSQDNERTTLPEFIGQLSQLQELDLQNNKLSTLPESIGQLSQLQILDLANNQLSTLPQSIGQLSQLEILDLDNNKLSTLPDGFYKLTNLKQLFLKHNTLTKETKKRLKEIFGDKVSF